MKNNKTLTPEQERNRDARRAHFKALVNHLKKMSEAERNKFSSNSIKTIEGHELSPANTILINLQRPGCKLVGGWKQWKKYNRHIIKGEQSLLAWAPIIKHKSDNNLMTEEVKFTPISLFSESQVEENKEAVPVEKFTVSTPSSPKRNMDTVRLIVPGEHR